MAGALAVPHEEGCATFLSALDGFLVAVEPLDDHALLAASHCWGWAVVDVVTHVRSGLDEVTAALLGAVGASAPPDRDAASYWLQAPPGSEEDPVPGIVATRRLGSAARRPSSAVERLRAVATALRAGVGRLDDDVVGFQGWTMTIGDFLATWAVELAVHQLDLGRDLDLPLPPADALALTRRTLEALLESRLPVEDDVDAALLGAGRRPPTVDERERLGPLADRLPLL